MKRATAISDEMQLAVAEATTGIIIASHGTTRELGYGLVSMLASMQAIIGAAVRGEPSKEVPRALLAIACDAVNTWRHNGCPVFKFPENITSLDDMGMRETAARHVEHELKPPFDRLEELVDSWRDTAAVERKHFGEAGEAKAALLEGMAKDVADALKGW